jgi:hypothetical protein
VRIVTTTEVPLESRLRATLVTANFFDAYEAPLIERGLSPTEIFLRSVAQTPRWVMTLMSLRNRIVRRLGLKDVGHLSDGVDKPVEAYQVGDRAGIFSILVKTETELLLGIDDSHLDVRVSVLKSVRGARATYVISTVVTVHNWLGRLYMVPVGRIHPVIVKALMRRAEV